MFAATALLFTVAIQSASPGTQCGHNLVYSPSKKAVLVVGGDNDSAKKMWARSAEGWKLAHHSGMHRSLAVAVSAFDQEAVMFGGAVPIPIEAGNINWKVSSETWAWDGNLWKLLTSEGPPARDHHAMAYDSARKRLVMYGGSDADPSGRMVMYGDTWEFDGAKWTKASDTGPFPRCHHTMAYDPNLKQIVMVGGFGVGNRVDPQTWTWNGTSWTPVTGSGPAARTSPRMAFDGRLNQIILFGGESGSTQPRDTWAWNGSTWTAIDKNGPPGRTVHALAYDPERKVTVLYGGAQPALLGDVWEFGEGGWKQIKDAK